VLLSTTDVDDFVNCWQETMAGSSILRPYNERRQALVLSFDGELNPFLNYTKGYHHPKRRRTYFKSVRNVIREIGETHGSIPRGRRESIYQQSKSLLR
jgi:hypothetical protein